MQLGCRLTIDQAIAFHTDRDCAKVLRSAGPAYSSKFNVVFYPGGATSLWRRFVPVFAAENRSDVTVLFDADQRPESEIPAASTIPQADDNRLGEIIADFTGCEIEFAIDGGAGGGDRQQLATIRRKFIDWTRAHVAFLPGNLSPEELLLSKLEDPCSDSNEDAKVVCARLAAEQLGLAGGECASSDDIFYWQRTALAKISIGEPEFDEVRVLLDRLIAEP